MPRPVFWLGGLAVLLLGALNLAPLMAVALRAEGWSGLEPADAAALRFTLLQAGLSALLSVGLALPVARALARRRFIGRGWLILMMGAPFILPSMVAVAGLLEIFGQRGLFNRGLGLLGFAPLSPYGLHGVLLVHVFFNLPLAVRLLLQGWERIPGEHLRLASSLGFDGWARFRHIEVPMLRQTVPGALAVVFMVCLSSFAVVLVMGGGPRATTLELAIYQAFRFEFDLGRAALLALIQTGIGLIALALLALTPLPLMQGGGQGRPAPSGPRGLALGLDTLAITLAGLLLLLPLAAVVVAGLPHLTQMPTRVWSAAGRTLFVAGLSLSLLAVLTLALALSAALARRHGWIFQSAGLIALTASPLVIGTGLFILIHPFAAPGQFALPVTALVNAAMALPFALRAVLPAVERAEAEQGRLAQALGLPFTAYFRLLLWPRLRGPLGFGLGLGAALSVGDLGVIVLFAQADAETLPLAFQRLLGAYRTRDAAAAALLLLILALAAFALVERLIGGPRHARA